MSASTPASGGVPLHGRPAAFFDLDKTIIAKSSALAFSRPFYAGGLINRRSVLRSAYAQFVFHLGGADHDQMEKMREFLSKMVTGWHVTRCGRSSPTPCTTSSSRSSTTRRSRLIEDHHLAGRDVIIVSASGTRDGRADRRAPRRRRGRRQPALHRGRAVHRRDRLLRLRREQGGGHARARRATRLRPVPQLRLLRLDHRRAHARGRRPPARGQPGQGAAQGRPGTRLADPHLRPAGRPRRPGAAARRSRARSPPWPRARRWSSAARSTSAPAAGSSEC